MTLNELVEQTVRGMNEARNKNIRAVSDARVTLTLAYSEVVVMLGRQRMTGALRKEVVAAFTNSGVELVSVTAVALTLRTIPTGTRTSFGSLQEILKYEG